jgi:hypothetical protein
MTLDESKTKVLLSVYQTAAGNLADALAAANVEIDVLRAKVAELDALVTAPKKDAP